MFKQRDFTHTNIRNYIIMKSTIRENIKQENDGFPKLMQYKGGDFIVLFERESVGTVVYVDEFLADESMHCVGYHSVCWKDGYFVEYKGVVNLRN